MRHKWLLLTCVIFVHATFAIPVDDSNNQKGKKDQSIQADQNLEASQNSRDITSNHNTEDKSIHAAHSEYDNTSTYGPEGTINNGNYSSHKDSRLYMPDGNPTTEKPSSVCTRTTLNYDCIFENIRLTHDESKTFGLNWKKNPQKNVTFIDSRLAILPKNLFEAFPEMEMLNAADLQIEEIENQAFDNAYNLKMLHLQRNYISSIETFEHVPLLNHLDLSGNRITHINQNAFEWNRQLKKLIMNNNHVAKLPTFNNNQNLEVLYLSNNELQTISNDKFRNNYMLQYLNISYNQLRLFNLQQLSDKSKLTVVDVSYNNLESLYVPEHVQKLDARNNSINYIEADVCTLKKLYLSNNQISDVSSLHKCTDLLFLDLSHNQLQSFVLIENFPKLNDLNLAHNNLFEIGTQTRYPHPLQFLDVSYNFLSYVPANKLSKLRNVKLNNNRFIDFKFSNLNGITFIKLSRNEWNCDVIVKIMQQKRNSIDDNQETCNQPNTISKNGICCRNYTRAFNDRLKEILRETNLHENLNKKDQKKNCTQINPDHTIIKPDLSGIIDLDSETKTIMQQLNKETNEIESVNIGIKSEKIKHSRLQQVDKQYQNMIEKLRGYYGIAKEGLISSNLTLNRVVQYIQERNNLSIDLLARRKQEEAKTEVQLSKKNFEKDTLINEHERLKTVYADLKRKEGALKKERQTLEKEFNRNSPSLAGKSG